MVTIKKLNKLAYVVFAFILIYNFIFPIRLNFIPGSEIILYVLSFSVIFFIRNNIINNLKSKEFLSLLLIIFVLFQFGIISHLINTSTDFYQFVMLIKYVFAFVLSIVLINFIIKIFHQESLILLLNFIILSGLLVAASCLLEFFLPEFKVFFALLIDTSGNIVYEDSFRVHGLATGGGASLSIGLMLTSLISFLMSKKTDGIKSIVYFLVFVFIYLCLLIVGRTGFFLLSFVIILYLIKNFYSFKVLIVMLVFSMLVYSSYFMLNEDVKNIIMGYGLEPINNFLQHGRFESKTTSHLSEMYYFPDVEHFFIGAGFWRYPTHDYILSDVGYMKVLLSFGIFGFLIFYLLQLVVYTRAFIFYKKLYNESFITFFIFFSLFIVEFKEAFFVQNYAFKILTLLVVFYFVKKKNFNNIILK